MSAFKGLPATAAFFFMHQAATAEGLVTRVCKVALVLICSSGICKIDAQVSMQSKLCTILKSDSDYIYEVRIRKGNIADFSRYQLNLPPGTSVNPVNTNSGSFSAEGGTVKVTWPITPPEAELQLSFNLHTGTVTGTFSILQKYDYVEKGQKKQVEVQPFSISVSQSPDVALSAAPQFTLLNRHVVSGLPGLDKNAHPSANAAEATLQVEQLKRDARDAREAGTREKDLAEKELATAKEELSEAEKIKDPTQRQEASDKASSAKQKAQNNQAIALKILELADRLEANAREIESLGSATQKDGKSAANGAMPPPSAGPEADKSPETGVALFRVQIGAFARDPGANAYEKLGAVTILNDKGLFKVLIGNYQSREEAQKKKEELGQRGIQGFVVDNSRAASH